MVNFLQTLFHPFRRRAPASPVLASPHFSIIIPVHLPGAKLQKSLDSLIDQPGVTLEVLVGEYGECPQARNAMDGFAGSLTRLEMSVPGIYEAMNQGISRASGSIFYFLGAGDRLRPGILPEILAAYDWTTSLLVYGDVFMEDLQITYDGPFDAKKLRKKNLCHQAVFYSRPLVRRHGYYDCRYRLLADYAYNLRVFGDPQTTKQYHGRTISDYEGGGLSAHGRDEAFMQDRAGLNQRYLPSNKGK